MAVEIWKPVAGFEGLYEVSNMGRVKSLGRIDRFNKRWEERILWPHLVGKNYLAVSLCKDGKVSSRKIHRLVAETFIPNPGRKPQVNHKDGNKENNAASNLEWSTNSENQLHARKNGLNPLTKNNPVHSKPVDCCNRHTGKVIGVYPSIAEAARVVAIPATNISACCKREFMKYTAAGFAWKFHESVVNADGC